MLSVADAAEALHAFYEENLPACGTTVPIKAASVTLPEATPEVTAK